MGGEVGAATRPRISSTPCSRCVNKTFEFVTIFGPALYYENPVRTVKPRMPVVIPPQFFPNPLLYQAMMQQENQRVMVDGLRGVLLEAYLNWTPDRVRLAERGAAGDRRGPHQGPGLPLDRAVHPARHRHAAWCVRSGTRSTTCSWTPTPRASTRRRGSPGSASTRSGRSSATSASGPARSRATWEPGARQADIETSTTTTAVRPQAGADQRPAHLLQDLLQDGDRRPAPGHQAATSAARWRCSATTPTSWSPRACRSR